VNTVLGRRAGLLRKDGQVIGVNGGLGVAFDDLMPGSYYIAIYHRSHIAVVSSTPVDLLDISTFYDFTESATAALGTNQLKLINGRYALYAGDYTGNGIANVNDYNAWQTESSKVGGYKDTDADGNNVVNNLDFNLWRRNNNQIGHSAIQFNE
jgi:hypothetical protein